MDLRIEIAGEQVVLDPQEPSLLLSFPKLPRHLLECIYGFFKFVYDRLQGEGIVFIYYSPALREFRAEAPPQTLTRYRTVRGWRTEGRVEYRYLPRSEGFLKLGDVHSHGDSHSFFSCMDDRDDGEGGLRVVVGDLDRAAPDVRASFTANGNRFELEVGDVLEDFATAAAPPEAWTRRISCRYEDVAHRQRSHRRRRSCCS